jgi:hypothetical protein
LPGASWWIYAFSAWRWWIDRKKAFCGLHRASSRPG